MAGKSFESQTGKSCSLLENKGWLCTGHCGTENDGANGQATRHEVQTCEHMKKLEQQPEEWASAHAVENTPASFEHSNQLKN